MGVEARIGQSKKMEDIQLIHDFDQVVKIAGTKNAKGYYFSHKLQDNLRELNFLTLDLAEALVKFQCPLFLDSLKNLSPDLAFILAKSRLWLGLSGISEITPNVAEILAAHGGRLQLDGLNILSTEVGSALAKSSGMLILDGVTELSEEAAQSLANHRGVLCLNGLTTLTDKAASALLEHRGDLSMRGLNNVSDNALKSLALQAGFVFLNQETENRFLSVKTRMKSRRMDYLRAINFCRSSAIRKGVEAMQVMALALPNNVDMEFCGIVEGAFMMRTCSHDDYDDCNINLVRARVSKPFWIAKTPVTAMQWEAVIGKSPISSYPIGDYVVNVTWEEAQVFVTKLNNLNFLAAGWEFALPTEAQWDYSCEPKLLSFGEHEEANPNFRIEGSAHDAPILSKEKNIVVRNIHVDFWEWCADWFEDVLLGGADQSGPLSGLGRVARGGSLDLSNGAPQKNRDSVHPDFRFDNLGFRIAIISLW